MPTVHYEAHVSDRHLKVILQRLAEALNSDITVHSGDRATVVKGSSPRSLHLANRAADFHVKRLSDEGAFEAVKCHLNVFDASEGYEFIKHGQFTNTGGPHLHLGHYPGTHAGQVLFKTEGLTPTTGGQYTVNPVRIFGGTPISHGEPHTSGTILHSVGAGGKNDGVDIKTIQHLLNQSRAKLIAAKFPFQHFEVLAEDGIIGKHTLEAITIFQHDVVGLAHPDGCVDPGGPTLKVLKAVAAGHIPHLAVKKQTAPASAAQLVNDAHVKAMLDVLGFTEGTGNNYGKVVNGVVLTSPNFPALVGQRNVSVTDLTRHPDILVQVNASIKSTAAGRYQFLKSTWDGLGMPDFSAGSQDIAAVKLMQRRGMIAPLLAGNLDQAVYAGAPEWASLPTAGGGSFYGGQPSRNITEIRRVYQDALQRYQGAPVGAH
ncbi:MAG TPA: glycoside hydrolase family 104 protein [Bryobacteraceae bacterium]|jgi:muramidase (phage lysozyme)|nr:glycoside hydrolase family 104 protein [Bryobacteraceae bacterium]